MFSLIAECSVVELIDVFCFEFRTSPLIFYKIIFEIPKNNMHVRNLKIKLNLYTHFRQSS